MKSICVPPTTSPASLTPMVAAAAATLGSSFSHLPVGRRQRRQPSYSGAAGQTLRMRLTNPSRDLAAPRRRRTGQGWAASAKARRWSGRRARGGPETRKAGVPAERRVRNDAHAQAPPLRLYASVAMETTTRSRRARAGLERRAS